MAFKFFQKFHEIGADCTGVFTVHRMMPPDLLAPTWSLSAS